MASGRTPGNVELTHLTLQTSALSAAGHKAVDLSKIFTELHVYEDMYSNFVSGYVTIKDSQNLINKLQLSGHDELDIKFRAEDVFGLDLSWFSNASDEPLKFDVHSISERSLVGERLQLYSLNFISRFAKINNIVKISKSYQGPVDEIIERVVEEYLMVGDLALDRFFTNTDIANSAVLHCVIPYWSPVQTVNWLAERCFSNGGEADCLFYEERDGLTLASLSELKSSGPTPRLLDPSGNTLYLQPTGAGNANARSKQRTLEGYSVQQSYDTHDLTQRGAYAAQVVTHDITRKKVVYHPQFNYVNNFEKLAHLDKKSYVPLPKAGTPDGIHYIDYPYASYRFQPKCAHLFGNAVPPVHTQNPEHWIAQRMSQLAMMKNITIGAKMPGDASVRLGDVIRWNNIPSPEPVVGNEMAVDKILSGNFLVTAIHHTISFGKYNMTLELTKDSVAEELA